MGCGGIVAPPSRIREWGGNWIAWLHEIYKRLSLGPCHANMYQYELGTTITISASGTYYQVTGMSAGKLRGFTFASDSLTCNEGGRYMVHKQATIAGTGGNVVYETAIQINGVTEESSASDTNTNGTNDASASGIGIADLSVGDVVTLAVNNQTNTNNATFSHASVTLMRLGDIPR